MKGFKRCKALLSYLFLDTYPSVKKTVYSINTKLTILFQKITKCETTIANSKELTKYVFI